MHRGFSGYVWGLHPAFPLHIRCDDRKYLSNLQIAQFFIAYNRIEHSVNFFHWGLSRNSKKFGIQLSHCTVNFEALFGRAEKIQATITREHSQNTCTAVGKSSPTMKLPVCTILKTFYCFLLQRLYTTWSCEIFKSLSNVSAQAHWIYLQTRSWTHFHV